MATGLVLLFGGIALGNQRKELEVQRELAISKLERERDERLAQAAHIATMGTFAMGVVHEVSTPLGVIVGRAEQLRARAGDDERSTNAAQTILTQVDRISGVIRRFLDMARGGAPSLARKPNPADPNSFTQQARSSTGSPRPTFLFPRRLPTRRERSSATALCSSRP